MTRDRRAVLQALNAKGREWRKILRGRPQAARLLVRRLIGPLVIPRNFGDAPTWHADSKVGQALAEAIGQPGRFTTSTAWKGFSGVVR